MSASLTYYARLEQPVGRRLVWSRLAWPVRFFAAGVGILDEPTFGDVVVRRGHDDAEMLRVPTHGSEEAASQLGAVQAQLEVLSPEEFQDAWAITD